MELIFSGGEWPQRQGGFRRHELRAGAGSRQRRQGVAGRSRQGIWTLHQQPMGEQ